MTPPMRHKLPQEQSNADDQGVNNERSRNLTLSEDRLRLVIAEFLRANFEETNSTHPPDVNINAELNKVIDKLFEESVRCSGAGEHEAMMSPETQQSLREGRILALIGQTFSNSYIRNKITQTAQKTILDDLDYVKFCQIISDMKGNKWFNEEMMVVILLYFKDVMYEAVKKGRFSKCYDIVKYLLMYVKERGQMVSMFVINYHFVLNIFHTTTNVFLTIGFRSWIYTSVYL